MRQQKEKKGFTLIELLLVIAIIGILAGAILVGVSDQREKAQRTSALTTAKSVLPYLTECYMKGGTVQNYASGSPLCNPDQGMNWPTMTNAVCTSVNVGTGITVDCGDQDIECSWSNTGRCVIRDL